MSKPSRYTKDRKINTSLTEKTKSAKEVLTGKPTTNWIDAKAKYLARKGILT